MQGTGAVVGAQVVTPDGLLEQHTVRFADGRITDITPEPYSGPGVVLTADGATLLPGFLDVHIHGGGGSDTMDATPDALRTICRTHARYGTTGLLATTMTQSRERITAALDNARRAYEAGPAFCPDGAQVLGIHLEGPYISPERPGAQPRQFVRDYDPEEFAEWLRVSGGAMKLITLAPERPGADALITACRQAGIVISTGHTDADAAQTRAALSEGVTHATHLFNAMPSIHHRKPGPIPVLLSDPRVLVEIIADGHHVSPEIIGMTFAARGPSGIALITDAMSGAGAPEGLYDLGGLAVTVSGGRATLADGTLAGSVLTMAQAARNVADWVGANGSERWPILAALTSGNVAREMGWVTKGAIRPGNDADLTLLSDREEVIATMVAGRLVYRRES
ncbi:MAG: N-acetylglucosamine-6-phosphate deacetylase [Capsulimonadales bacterium]|nr:N-acetylglucosamine-6-phosphate deacetylase [Capsulimonadales bacterium]